jgi:hypothetical protein
MVDHNKPTNLNKSFSLALSIALSILTLLLMALMLASYSRTAYAATTNAGLIANSATKSDQDFNQPSFLRLLREQTDFGITYLPLSHKNRAQGVSLSETSLLTYTLYLPFVSKPPDNGPGSATGRILWNDQPLAGVTVKLCTDWSMFGGCQTQVYSAVSGIDGRYTITDIPAGKYDFATKLYGQVETGWLGFSVTVIAGQTVTIKDVAIVKYDLKLISPIDHATVTTATPTLTWEAYPDAVFYKVYVQNVVSFEKVTTTQYTFANPLAAGDYYWSIHAYNAAEKKIAEAYHGYRFVVAP